MRKSLRELFTNTLVGMLTVTVAHHCHASGVTVITHGFELSSGLPGWVSEMANQIRSVPSFPGTNFTDYRITITYSNSFYYVTHNRNNGGPPMSSDSGEIVVELDWSQISGDVLDTYASTAEVASAVVYTLTQTNLIAEMNGHALAESPIHLIGHSRGGSLMSEVCHQLGTNSIWVDHLTTLDPYPLNNDGNTDFPPATVVDAPVRAYATVLFADNYWQNLGVGYALGDPDGESVTGAYNRELTALSGGYWNISSFAAPDHSNVHLWYHGTIDTSTPSSDGSASISSSERQGWWVSYEQEGTNAGFRYSLIGLGNRSSTAMPLGAGFPAVVDGFNQWWDFGAGNSVNRTPLPVNKGTWPNLIKFDIVGTNVVAIGQTIATKLFYQYGGVFSNVTAEFFFAGDFNPYGTNSRSIKQITLPNTGVNSVYYDIVGLTATNVLPGIYAIYGKISDGAHTRYLYTPELLTIVSNRQPPLLGISKLDGTQFHIVVNGLSGQTIVLQTSIDLQNWLPLATNTLTVGDWIYTNNTAADFTNQFYRALPLE